MSELEYVLVYKKTAFCHYFDFRKLGSTHKWAQICVFTVNFGVFFNDSQL